MHDLLSRLLVTSDPVVNSMRGLPQRKLRVLAPQAIELLVEPTVDESDSSYSESSDESSNCNEFL